MKEDAHSIHLAPWLHIVSTNGGVPLDELLPGSGSVYVARLDGRKMSDDVSTLQQFDEALKFPSYFGWNWNAFNDCLRDLQWLASDHHVLIIESAEQALSEDQEGHSQLLKNLWQAGRGWSYVKRPEGVTLSRLSIILSCDEESVYGLAGAFQELQERSAL
ncbi:barstar family protein [Streptomyces sp. PvR006]|uniref:barstar family protein n=1 Tax=Streptomyces sp. PvR006 TaxID=2817860 RepID=UPI00247B1E50|nr:barstar family protein [Streptomyces sp. PvR006]